MDEIVCTECGAEPGFDGTETFDVREFLADGGWDLDGEFGERCPECVGEANRISEGTAGLDELAAALGATKKGEPAPIGIEFSQQVRDTTGLGGSVDYEGSIPTEPVEAEKPKPDVMVRMTHKKET